MSDNEFLNLDEIIIKPKKFQWAGVVYEIQRLSMYDQFKFTFLTEQAEKLKSKGNVEGYAAKMQESVLMVCPEFPADEFRKLRGPRVLAFLNFIRPEEVPEENPTKA